MNGIIESFDYAKAGLSDDAKPLEMIAAKIEKAQGSVRKASVEAVLLIGRELIAAREILGHHGDGMFRKWARERFDYADSTITRIIAVRETFGDVFNLNRTAAIDVSALYLLSAPTVPEEVVAEAVERANAGERVTHKEVKEMIAATVDPDPAPPAPSIAVPTPRSESRWTGLDSETQRRVKRGEISVGEANAIFDMNTDAGEPTDDPAEPAATDGTTEGECNQEDMDEEGAKEGQFHAHVRVAVLDLWGQYSETTKAEVCSVLDAVRAEIWETYK